MFKNGKIVLSTFGERRGKYQISETQLLRFSNFQTDKSGCDKKSQYKNKHQWNGDWI